MTNLTESIATALQYYQSGQLVQVELICHQVLQQQPHNVEALYLLAIAAHQVGNLQDAIAYYQQIIAFKPDHGASYYSLGVAMGQLGQLPEAIDYYQQAIAINPYSTDAHYNLGYALQQQGNLPAAIKHYQQVLALEPNDAEAHGNLAHALLQQGQIEAAIAHYQQAIAIRPHVPEIYYTLGEIFRQLHQLETAGTYYRLALASNPNYIDAAFKLGATLHLQGHLQEASLYYQKTISLEPNFADAHYNLGKIFLEQGQHPEAISQYQQALALEPNLEDAYLGLGCALIHQFKFAEAAVCFQQALVIQPDYAEAYQNLGIALANQNKLEAAIACFHKVLQLKPDWLEAYWQSQLILPILYDTQEQVLFWRRRFCQALNQLIRQTALETPESRTHALKILEKIPPPFYLGYQGLHDRGLQSKYGKFVHQVMAAHYPQWAVPLSPPLLSPTEKIRIGYLSAHFHFHTVAHLTLGWLQNCNRQRFEIYTYHIGYEVDSITDKFRSCSDSFFHIYSSMEAVCQQIVADKLHILIFPGIGLELRTLQIAALRLAPVQCMFWGHPLTSGLPTIDYFISSELMEPENGEQHYCEKLVRLPNISLCYDHPEIPEPSKTRSDFQLRPDTIIYLSCQSLYKYLPQFDYIFAKIAQRVPQSQFVFIGARVTSITDQFQARIQRAFTNLGLNSADYCIFLPQQNYADYINLNLMADIFLDTFSWSGGRTTLEAIACGLPIVTCPGEFLRGRHAYGMLQMMGVTETIAQNEAEYIEIAARLGLDSEWRQAIVRKIYERHSWLYNDRTCVTALESFLSSKFARSK